jgi:hypothetical protein
VPCELHRSSGELLGMEVEAEGGPNEVVDGGPTSMVDDDAERQ